VVDAGVAPEPTRLRRWWAPDDRPASWRPARINRVGDLSVQERVAFWVLIAIGALLPLISAIIVLRHGWRPTGDNALIGLRVHDVLTGRFPLIGQPSTGENFGSVATSHPGPIEFYLVAPFALILGPTVGLAVGAASINSAGLVGIAWLAFRRGGLGLMLGASAVSCLMARSFGGNLLHDPVSSNVGAVMALTVLFAAWCVIAGDLRAVPVFVVAGSFALEDHLSFLGTLAPTVIVGIGLVVWWSRQVFRRASDPTWLRKRLVVSGAVGAVIWLPVLIDELFGDHNMTALVKTLIGNGGAKQPGTQSAGLGFAVKRMADALAPWPMFSHRVAALGWLHTPATHEVVLGYAIVVALVAFTVHFVRQRRTDLAALGIVAVVSLLSGVYTSVKLPSGAGVKAANLRWMWTCSAFVWIALGLMIWAVLPSIWREILALPGAVSSAVIVLVAAVAVVSSTSLATDRDGTAAPDTSTLIGHVKDNLPKGSYRVIYAGNSVVLTVGPALVHDLDQRGDHLYVDIGDFSRAYAHQREWRHQDVDGTIVLTSEASGSYAPRTRLLGRQAIQVNRTDADPTVVRVYLVPGSS
jgi:hypothetical protein